MNKAQQFEQNIRELLENTTSFDLEHLSLMEEMDFTALMQSVRHHAETVFVYRVNSAHDIGRDYRQYGTVPCPGDTAVFTACPVFRQGSRRCPAA